MPPWLKNTIMLGVLGIWAGYMGVSVLGMRSIPPLPLWGVPGATYALISGRTPKFKLTTDDKDPEDDTH